MSTLTPELWAEIAQHLRASSVIRHGMILEDMERGMDAEQIASRQRITRDTATSYMRDVERVLYGKLGTCLMRPADWRAGQGAGVLTRHHQP